jgi:hypothetical protein
LLGVTDAVVSAEEATATYAVAVPRLILSLSMEMYTRYSPDCDAYTLEMLQKTGELEINAPSFEKSRFKLEELPTLAVIVVYCSPVQITETLLALGTTKFKPDIVMEVIEIGS